MAENKRKRRGFPPSLYFVLPATLTVGIIVAFPLAYAVFMSLFNWPLVGAQRTFIGLGNYLSMFKNNEFINSVLRQVGVVVIAVPIELVIGFFVAILFDRKFPGSKILRSLILLPAFVLPVLSGLTWRLMLAPQYGPLTYLMQIMGFPNQAWLANPQLAYAVVIIQDVWRMWPFMFAFIYGGLMNVPKELIEAAKIDGSGFWNTILKILLPVLEPTIAIAVMFRIVDILRIFPEVYVMTGGGPGDATMLFSLYIQQQAFSFFNIGYASAMSMLLLAVSIVIAVFLAKNVFEANES